MSANENGMWDFKSYTERTWFRDLIFIFLIAAATYVALHALFNFGNSNYEYTRLNQDQMQFINRIYMDHQQQTGSNGTGNNANNPPINPAAINHNSVETKPIIPTSASVVKSQGGNTNKNSANIDKKTVDLPKPQDTCMSKDTCPCIRVMDYLDNIFEKKLDVCQAKQVRKLLSESNPQQATAFLNVERFKVHSYFWLVGPAVYWEVVFWSFFGVLCSLLFILGAVGSNATTDLGNPQSQFDSSEILGQVAKMLYAPLCTLAVVLGYNFFKDQNIVDIDSSKGLIVFAFIGGFYSSRVISLMDRLKDVLLPNSGTSSLPTPASGNSSSAIIPQFSIQIALNPSLRAVVQSAAAGVGLNTAVVTMQSAGNPAIITATRQASDANGLYTFSSVTPGIYTIKVALAVNPPGSTTLTLTGQQSGQVMTGIAPLTITIQ